MTHPNPTPKDALRVLEYLAPAALYEADEEILERIHRQAAQIALLCELYLKDRARSVAADTEEPKP